MYIEPMGYLALVLAYYFCVYGLAQIVSMLMQPDNAQLVGVVVTLFAAVLGGYIPGESPPPSSSILRTAAPAVVTLTPFLPPSPRPPS